MWKGHTSMFVATHLQEANEKRKGWKNLATCSGEVVETTKVRLSLDKCKLYKPIMTIIFASSELQIAKNECFINFICSKYLLGYSYQIGAIFHKIMSYSFHINWNELSINEIPNNIQQNRL